MRHLRAGLAAVSASCDKGVEGDNITTPRSGHSSEQLDWATTHGSLRSGAFVSPQQSLPDRSLAAPFLLPGTFLCLVNIPSIPFS